MLANGGLLPRVTFTRVDQRPELVRVMSAKTVHQVRAMLEAVAANDGSGHRARVSGYRIGGKTGTVRKSGIGGYSDERHLALFAGMAPLSAPRLVSVVMIDEPGGKEYYGGQLAAPVFSEVMAASLRVLGVTPDDNLMAQQQASLSGAPLPERPGAQPGSPTPIVLRQPAGGPIGEVVR